MSQFVRPAWLTHKALVVLATSGFLVVFLIWSLFAELEQISRAPGQVIPTGRVQLVQSSDGGVISEILVREGDTVQAGQVVARIDPSEFQARVRQAHVRGHRAVAGHVQGIKAHLIGHLGRYHFKNAWCHNQLTLAQFLFEQGTALSVRKGGDALFDHAMAFARSSASSMED